MCIRGGLALFLLLVSVGTGMGQGQNQPQAKNGFWWVSSSDGFKVGFASGYAMAMVNVEDIETYRCLADKNGGTVPEKYPGDEALKACGTENPRLAPYNFDNLRVGQLSEGVDVFYKDF